MATWTLEIAKLVLQLAGALLIAWLTVRWALGRFKSEKIWEKRTTAYADLLAALREMSRVLDKWIDEEENAREYTEQYSDHLRERWQRSLSKFEDVAAIGVVIFPTEIAAIVGRLEAELADLKYGSWDEKINLQAVLIQAGANDLVAKKHLLISAEK